MSLASLPPLRNDLVYPQSRNELQINSRSTCPSPVHSSDRIRDRNRNVSPLGFPGAAGPLLDSPMSLPGPYLAPRNSHHLVCTSLVFKMWDSNSPNQVDTAHHLLAALAQIAMGIQSAGTFAIIARQTSSAPLTPAMMPLGIHREDNLSNRRQK